MKGFNHMAGGDFSGHFFQMFALICKVELTIVLSVVFGTLISVVLLFSIPSMRPTLALTAYVKSCDSKTDQVINAWLLKQQSAGISVNLGRLPDDESPASDERVYRLIYTSLGPIDYFRVWLSADDDHPFPAAFHTSCDPEKFEFDNSPFRIDLPISMVGWYVAIFLIAAFQLRFNKSVAVALPNHAAGLKAFYWVPVGVVAALIVSAVSLLMQSFGVTIQDPKIARLLHLAIMQPAILLLVTIIGPICEELLFRRLLFEIFVQRGRSVFGALIVSVSFAGMHWAGGLPYFAALAHFVIVFALSLMTCWVYWRTRSVCICALVHASYNASTLATALVHWHAL